MVSKIYQNPLSLYLGIQIFRDRLVIIDLSMCVCVSDVIFLIYLYQRWVYPVDKTRVNEFGFGGEDETAEKKLITEKEEEDKKTN